MKDKCGRVIEYMRISVTDRCNLRCAYCMPEGCEKLPMSRILTYEEIERICKAASKLGISRIKITGGEPFVRLGITDLIRSLKSIEGIDEVTLTTNGQVLADYTEELKEIGIDGINISMDTLKPGRFKELTGGGDIRKTIEGIDASLGAGIKTKLNCLIQKDFNEDEISDLAEFGLKRGADVRFIEMMPIGIGRNAKGLPNDEVLAVLTEKWGHLERDAGIHGNGPAEYFRVTGYDACIGLISSVHGKFCSSCNRIRITSTGEIKPCLCYEDTVDLRSYLAGSDEDLKDALKEAILSKPKSHIFEKMSGDAAEASREGRVEQRYMSEIGG